MNLRLDPEREKALADEARRTRRSQADVIRDALDAYFADAQARTRRHVQALIDNGELMPAEQPYRRVTPSLVPTSEWEWETEREDRI